MKLLILLIGLIIFYFSRNNFSFNSKESVKSPNHFYSLKDGNQNENLISINISPSWLSSLKEKYDWNDFNEYDNILWEYMYKLFDESIEKSGIKDQNELWNKLNRQQKVFWAFLSFSGDTDNGGVYQFIFNRPQFIFAAKETWNELGLKKLEKDYTNVIIELSGKKRKINESKSDFLNESKSWNKRWNSFAQGYKELKTPEIIEAYYYDKEYKRTLYKTVVDYIDSNIDKFADLQ
ncbi:MAG: DMP19 family protein [Tenacibaculum sp.]|nr:DMP19 family protein [Tenacibaculum sp.]